MSALLIRSPRNRSEIRRSRYCHNFARCGLPTEANASASTSTSDTGPHARPQDQSGTNPRAVQNAWSLWSIHITPLRGLSMTNPSRLRSSSQKRTVQWRTLFALIHRAISPKLSGPSSRVYARWRTLCTLWTGAPFASTPLGGAVPSCFGADCKRPMIPSRRKGRLRSQGHGPFSLGCVGRFRGARRTDRLATDGRRSHHRSGPSASTSSPSSSTSIPSASS